MFFPLKKKQKQNKKNGEPSSGCRLWKQEKAEDKDKPLIRAVAGGLLLPGLRKYRRLLLGSGVHGSKAAQPSATNACVVRPSKAVSIHHAQVPSFEVAPSLTLPIPTRPSGTSSSLRPPQSTRGHGVPHLLKQQLALPQGYRLFTEGLRKW